MVTSSMHTHAQEWQVASEGAAVTPEATRILGCTARLVPLAFESQGRWGQSTINELERLARLKGGLLPTSQQPAARVGAVGSVSCSNVGMRLWCLPRWANRSQSRSMRTCSREGGFVRDLFDASFVE